MTDKKENIEYIIQGGIDRLLNEGYRDMETDGPWRKIGTALEDKDLEDKDRETLIQNSRDRYWKTPEGRNLIDNAKHFIIGKGIVYTADDENPIVQEEIDRWWKSDENKMELRQKEIVLRTLRDSECFVRFFDSKDEYGQYLPVLRFVEPDQIQNAGIKCDANDAEKVVSYTRKWTPAGETTQKEETIPADDIIHIKLSDLDMKRGRFYLEGVIKRLVQLEQFIEGRARRNKIMAAIILEKILHGKGATASQVSSIEGGMSDATTDPTKSKASKKMPKFGSVVTHNDAIEYKWNTADIKSHDCKEDARLIKLSICAGVNAPEYLLSDASNANYASTMVAENPYVRAIEDMQDTFGIFFSMIFKKVIKRMMNKGIIPKDSTETVVRERRWIAKVFPKAKSGFLKSLREALVDKEVTVPCKTKTTVTIEFPPLIHKELKADSEAYQIHDAQGWASARTIASKLGYDYDKERDEIKKHRKEEGIDPDKELEKDTEDEIGEE